MRTKDLVTKEKKMGIMGAMGIMCHTFGVANEQQIVVVLQIGYSRRRSRHIIPIIPVFPFF